MNCPTCKGPMRPLLTSWFCPKDCDRKGAEPTATKPPRFYACRVDEIPSWAKEVAWFGSSSPESLRPYVEALNKDLHKTRWVWSRTVPGRGPDNGCIVDRSEDPEWREP